MYLDILVLEAALLQKEKASKMAKQEQVVGELVADKAKRDASYEYSKDSKEPVAEGAFKGALASGLTSRFIRGGGAKAQAANLVAGVTAGAAAGKIYNNKKVDKAQKARRWLSDNRKEKTYANKAKDIYKESSSALEDPRAIVKDPYGTATALAEENKPKKKTAKGVLKDVTGGALLGGAMGLLTKGKVRGLAVRKGAAIGGAGTAASDVVEGKSQDSGVSKTRAGQVLGMGASFAAGGAVEPAVNRVMGRFSKDKAAIQHEKDTFSSAWQKNKKAPKSEFLKGENMKGLKFKDSLKGLKKPTLKAAGKYGAMGVGVGLLMDKLTHPKLDKQASISFSSDDIIKAKTNRAKKRINHSYQKELAAGVGLSGLGYLVGRAIGGHKVGMAASGAGLAYVAKEGLSELKDRYDAREYMSKGRGEKLLALKEEYDENKIAPDTFYKTVALNHFLS